MRDEHKITRNGKTYVLYGGLLAEAHERFHGFKIETELIEGGEQPIVKATFDGWPEHAGSPSTHIRTSGIGTAGRQGDDKSPAARTAPIEMAETRAKARALRDAVNVGETAFEELSDTSDSPSQPSQNQPATARSRPSQPRQRSNPTPTPPKRQNGSQGRTKTKTKSKETEGRIKRTTLAILTGLLEADAERKGTSYAERLDQFQKYTELEIGDLSEGEGQEWIERFQTVLNNQDEEEE